MRLGRRAPEEPQLNLTSLIDVVFLLLIFFMVTTTFVKNSGLQIRLPEAGSEVAPAAEENLEVIVDANNRIIVRGAPVTSDAGLRQQLRAAAGDNFKQPLRIRADGRASHQAVVRVMDAAAALGFAQVDIATQPVQDN